MPVKSTNNAVNIGHSSGPSRVPLKVNEGSEQGSNDNAMMSGRTNRAGR